MDQNLINKANGYLEQGKDLAEVKQLLTQDGWTMEQIEQSFSEYAAQQQQAPASAEPTPEASATPTPAPNPTPKPVPTEGPSPVTTPAPTTPTTPSPEVAGAATSANPTPPSDTPDPTTPPEFREPGGMKKGLIILIVVLLLAGLSAIAYVFFFSQDDTTNTTPANLSTTQVASPESETSSTSDELPVDPNANMEEETLDPPQLESDLDDNAPQNLLNELPNDNLPKLPKVPQQANEDIMDCIGVEDEEACFMPFVETFAESLETCTPAEGDVVIGFEALLGLMRHYEIPGVQGDICVIKYTALETPIDILPEDIVEFHQEIAGRTMTCEMVGADLKLEKVHDLTGCSGKMADLIKEEVNYI